MSVALIVLLAGLLLALLLLVLVLRSARARARRDPAAARQGAAQAERGGAVVRLQAAVLTLFAGLVTRLPRLTERYDLPLLMLAGDGGSGKSAVLAHSGLAEADAAPDVAVRGQLQAWHFNQAVVLEVGGGYLGEEADTQDAAPAWHALGAQLQRYRPRRPLDGVVLCLPGDLLAGPGALGIGQLEQHAARMQRRLGELQALLGLRLPVYLLITKSDQLEGYASFAATLPPALRAAMLGWSNPNPTDAAFAPEWAGQAFDAIVASVARLQAELVAGNAPLADADAFFMLTSSIGKLRDGVGAYLVRLLCQNAQGEPVFFRGVYLCGAAGTGAPPAPVFLADLMKQKVVPESSLARPLRGQVFSRNSGVRRWRRATALLVLVWGAGLFRAYYELDQRSQDILTAVTAIDNFKAERDACHLLKVTLATGAQAECHLPLRWYNKTSQDLMATMGKGRSKLRAWALPFSWGINGADIDAQIDNSFRDGLENVVFQAIAKGLNQKAAGLAGLKLEEVTTNLAPDGRCAPPPSATEQYTAQTPPTGLAEFAALSTYVDDVEAFDKKVESFTLLQTPHQGDLDALGELGIYTGAFRPTHDGVVGKESYLSQALKGYDAGDKQLARRGDFQPGLRCGFQQRADVFYARLLEKNPVLTLSGDIDDNMHASDEARLINSKPLTADNFEHLKEELGDITTWLDASNNGWLHTSRADFGSAYVALKAQVAAVPMLGLQSEKYLDDKAASGLGKLEAALTETSNKRNGPPVLQRNADRSRLQLTPELAHLAALLAELRAQPFMAPAAQVRIAGVPPGQLALWNMDGLNQALLLRDQQHDYLARTVGSFPAHFQAEVQAYANAGLAQLLVADIDAAQGATASAQEAYVRLGQSEKLLSELLNVLTKLNRGEQRSQLAARLSQQAGDGLAWADAQFAAAGVYQPRDKNFGWWDGSRDPAAQGFAAGDPQALNDYLDQQHNAVAATVKLARPLLRLLNDSGGDATSAPAAHLASLMAEYDRYDAKQPGNRIAALDAYVRGELSEVDQHSCYDKPSAALTAHGNDFFTARERELAGRLAARCGEIGRSGGSSAYGALASLFSRTLAHKFPFAQPGGGGRGDADPADVSTFLQAYDQQGAAALRMLPRAPSAGPATGSATGASAAPAAASAAPQPSDSVAAARVRRFLDGAAGARKFLAPVLAGADGAAPAGYDVSVRFRVDSHGNADNFNQLAGEVDGNKIVAWTLQIGDRVLSWQNGSKNEVQTLPWKVGMPVLLTLRWSDNVATLPVDDGADPYRSVRGREVRYSYSEPWSLLRLLASRRQPDVATARYDTLQFDFPTAIPALPGAGPGPANTRAHVYMRLGLTAANQKDALIFPGFPFDAPGLDTPTLIARP